MRMTTHRRYDNCLYFLMPLMIILCSCNSTTFSESLASSLNAGSDSDTTLSQFTDITSTVLLQGGIYENSELGFQITFPDSWKNYYVIDWAFTDDKKCLCVSFYGESPQSHYDDTTGIIGLPMYYICTEAYYKSCDGISGGKLIGFANGQDFYKFSPSDYPLDLVNPEHYLSTCSTEELNIIKQDYEKAKEMETEIEEILKSFKSIQ